MISSSHCPALECPLSFNFSDALAEARSPYFADSCGFPQCGRHGHDSFFKSAFGDPERLSRLLVAGAKKNPGFAEFLAAVDFATMRAVPEGVAGEFGAGNPVEPHLRIFRGAIRTWAEGGLHGLSDAPGCLRDPLHR